MDLRLEIQVNGYVSRILCEEIPLASKEAFTEFLRCRRDEADLPKWQSKMSTQFVSPTEVSMWWYRESDILRNWMRERGIPWKAERHTQVFHRFTGLGSGREGIGLFDLAVGVGRGNVCVYYPFGPPEGMDGEARRMDRISVCWLNPPGVPTPARGHVVVVSGTWARGTMVFRGELDAGFEEGRLEIMAMDLSGLGVGEDHFVTGLRYDGRNLAGEILREEGLETYPVCWYSPARRTWVGMGEEE